MQCLRYVYLQYLQAGCFYVTAPPRSLASSSSILGIKGFLRKTTTTTGIGRVGGGGCQVGKRVSTHMGSEQFKGTLESGVHPGTAAARGRPTTQIIGSGQDHSVRSLWLCFVEIRWRLDLLLSYLFFFSFFFLF